LVTIRNCRTIHPRIQSGQTLYCKGRKFPQLVRPKPCYSAPCYSNASPHGNSENAACTLGSEFEGLTFLASLEIQDLASLPKWATEGEHENTADGNDLFYTPPSHASELAMVLAAKPATPTASPASTRLVHSALNAKHRSARASRSHQPVLMVQIRTKSATICSAQPFLP
jgi:hypothetical protein